MENGSFPDAAKHGEKAEEGIDGDGNLQEIWQEKNVKGKIKKNYTDNSNIFGSMQSRLFANGICNADI